MNEFYHDVVVTFNAWFLVGPSMILAMWLIGVGSNKIDMVDLEIIEKDNDRSLKWLAAFLSLLLHVLIVVESGKGILQVMLNHTDSPAWLVVVIPMLTSLSLVLTWYALYMSGRFGKWTTLGYLVYARAKIEEEREEQKKEERRFKMIDLSEEDDNIIDFPKEIELIK